MRKREGEREREREREMTEFVLPLPILTKLLSFFLQVMTLLTKAAALRWLY